MSPETLEALKASIAKWERNAVAETPGDYTIGSNSCALCSIYFDARNCWGCPVVLRSGKPACCGTPYINAVGALYDWKRRENGDDRERAHAAARDEVAFLKSLLPQSEGDA